MDVVRYDPFFSWFSAIPILARYLIVVGVVYIPAILCAMLNKTLWSLKKGDNIPFIRDYTFHAIWMLFIPTTLILLPWHYHQSQEMIEALSAQNVLPHRMASNAVGFQHGPIFPLAGSVVAIGFVTLIVVVNHRSLRKMNETVWSWWLPEGKRRLATVFFFAIHCVAYGVLFSVLFRYAHIVKVIRDAVLSLPSIPSWLGDSSGVIWCFFRSFFLSLLPFTLIPVCIWIARTFRGRVPLSNPVTIFSMIILPVSVLLLVILPIVVTGIPSRLASQRDGLLRENAEKVNNIFLHLSEAQQPPSNEALEREMKMLSAKREFILKHYKVWPISSLKAVVAGILSAIPAILAMVCSLMTILKDLAGRFPRSYPDFPVVR